jgi:membrane peptidoglycan carboxypeptidase
VTDQHTLFRLIDKIYYTPHPFIEGSGDPVLLYSAKSESQEISHERSGSRVLGILYNVVRYGTGRRAKEGVHGFPVFGKTGTTNRSLNAAFCGVIPASRDGEWSFRDGLFISSYVGFDQPKPMQKGRYGISGASGALPIWLHVAFGAVEAGLLGEKPHSSVWNGFSGFQSVSVSKDNGFPTADGSAQIFSDQDLSGDVVRYFSPVYIDGVGQEDLLHSFQGFADDTGVDILIPKEE